MSEKVKYDFGGYVTKNDLECTDGRIIRHGAFDSCDGARVPLVFMHNHRDMNNVLGFVDLECRPDGVYGRGAFNNSEEGQSAKERVMHGDITQMSIYANQLKERAKEVYHGVIREVSLVLAGANPGAVIDNLNFVHSDGSFDLIDDEAIIKPNFDFEFAHADEPEDEKDDKDDGVEEVAEDAAEAAEDAEELQNGEEEDKEEEEEAMQHADGAEDGRTVGEVFEAMSDKKKQAAQILIGLAKMQADGEDVDAFVKEAAANTEEGEENLQDILDSMTEEEQNVVYFLVGKAAEDDSEEEAEPEEMEQSDNMEEGDNTMAHMNVFEQDALEQGNVLTHADVTDIFKDARSRGSLKEAWEDFAAEHEYDPDSLSHGITNIDVFFPEAQAVQAQPSLISRRMEWVDVVLAGVRKSPFSRVKSMAANLTAEEARAKGYIKGTKKVEEQISALKRVTNPTTIYKLQKLDRDDVIDIVDFDVVVWMKAEMRMMLNEECARAYLVGDGRLASSNDKIDESCIRPIWTDAEVYAIHSQVADNNDPEIKAKNFIDAAIRAKKSYKGSGTPTLFVGPELLTEMRLIKDEMGHRLYKNDQELADELRVSRIVEVEIMDGLERTVNNVDLELGGIIVNLVDYNVGATRGGEVTLFDDFDLNFNKYEYLIETRQSGALIQPASALVLEFA